jgi:hypothetical protein
MDADAHQGRFQTRRQILIAKYDLQVDGDQAKSIKAKGPYTVSTKPLHSTLLLPFEVVNADAENQLAFAVCRKGTTLDFFSYGIGDQIPLPQPQATNRGKATDADTNLSKAKQTNGSANFCIEALSMSGGPFYYEDAGVTGGEGDPQVPFPTQIPTGTNLDKDVQSMVTGVNAVADPASIVQPPQVYSPFNLENVFFEAVQPRMSLQLLWDEQRTEKLGTLRNLAQGGGGSALRSNGHPLCSNAFRVEEGYLWAAVGETDSELVVRATLNEAVVIPLTLNDNPTTDDEIIVPAWIYMAMQLKLHGFEFKYESRN